ncbi:MAG: hypothetical protein MI717_02115 [Spirochaetales bacterium]|nr:hypothetical protein [Spirochaetales bacterium]
MIKRSYTLLALLATILVSCSSIPKEADTEWTQEMFFKNAQEAMDANDYKAALYYYGVFRVRYPEDQTRGIAAEYEQAFIRFKMRDYDAAESGYREILRKYEESPYAVLFHPRFKELSSIGLKSIEKKRKVENTILWRRNERLWAESQGEVLTDINAEY